MCGPLSLRLLDDADLGGSKYSAADLPTSLNYLANMIVIVLFTFGNHEYCIVEIWIKLFSNWIKLHDIKFSENLIHHTCCHFLTLNHIFKLRLDQLDIFIFLESLQVDMLKSKSQIIPDVKELLGEFCDCELLAIFDLLPVSLDCVIVFGHLICELLFVLFDILLELSNLLLMGLYRLILFGYEGLDLFDILWAKFDILIRGA